MKDYRQASLRPATDNNVITCPNNRLEDFHESRDALFLGESLLNKSCHGNFQITKGGCAVVAGTV